MRVDAYNKVSQLYQATSPKKTEKQNKGSQNDTLEISDFGKEFQIAKKAAKEVPDVREDRVNAIKSAMESGTYHVSMEDVADKLLSNYF